MNEQLCYFVLCSQLYKRVQVIYVAVHSAIGQQPEYVQGGIMLFTVLNSA
jgi:hypothetical protein